MKRASKLTVLAAIVAILILVAWIWNYWVENVGTSNRFESKPSFVGNIVIGVIESRFLGGEEYRVYSLDLAAGRIEIQQARRFASARDEVIQRAQSPGAHIDRCDQNSPLVYSPNGRYVASCSTTGPDTVVIRAVGVSNDEVCKVPLWRSHRVSGIVWSPRSDAITILERGSRVGWGPADMLSFVSGHPVPYNWFAVGVQNISCSDMLSINYIGREFRYGWANIIEWR